MKYSTLFSMQKPWIFLCLLLIVSAIGSKARRRTNPSQTTSLRIVNHANRPIDVFWMENNSPSELVPQLHAPLRNSTDTHLWSYDTHQFLLQYTPSHLPDELKSTHPARLIKGAHDETYFVLYNASSNSLYVQAEDKYLGWKNALGSAQDHCLHLTQTALADCLTKHVHAEVNGLTNSVENLMKSMSKVSYRLRNYTCDDDSLPTSTPIFTDTFSWPTTAPKSVVVASQGKTPKEYHVQFLLNMTQAKIWLMEDLITDEECAVLEKIGRPKLHRATVAAEDGSSVVSEHRKAQQASYDYHQQRGEQDPLWDLQQRILAITNHYGGFNLAPAGQEGFTIIQYNPDDQYTPHCDGNCDHSMHITKGRVATAVMYCQVPSKGGATTFTRANLLVRPKKGAVTFFTYKGGKGDDRMDSGYTEHSGCPVKEGEKLITTFWMREGVSEREPWSRYDPTGLPILDMTKEDVDG